MSKLYTDKSIESLSPLEFTRLRPGVYAGDTTYSTQLLIEIVSNAVDEFRLGHGNEILVRITDKTMYVRDYGQGFIPNSYREDGKTILEAAFSVLNTSGKYREDGTYEGTSLGSFGIGSKITTFLSHWLVVDTWRNGEGENITFKEGVFESRKKLTPMDYQKEGFPKNGTGVLWMPSEEFFTNVSVEVNKIKNLFKTISCLCPGLKIILEQGREKESSIEMEWYSKDIFYSENGLNDLVDEAVKGKEIISNRFDMKFAEGKYKMDLVMTYTSNYSSTIVPYVNTGLTESGPHITQLKTTLTREFNKYFREKKWLKDKDENLTGDDIQEGMYLVFNITAPNVSYDAQVKSRITKLETKPFIQAFAENLYVWFETSEKEIRQIADKALAARKAREAAKRARDNAREKNKKKEKALKFDSKLADCWSKDRAKCELYITEGDSASGNLKTARGNEFQAVMPIRGKMLNLQKATIEKIQKNAEVMTIIEAIGLELNPKTLKYEIPAHGLRYGKIIIMSDADVDGAHIKNLFYTDMWNVCPDLFLKGYVYAGVPPLYKITMAGKYHYLKNDAALEDFRQKNIGKKYQVNRLKGLGEMDVEETEETLTNPENRIIKQITVEDIEQVNILFEQLMGTGVTARKQFIKDHSEEATYAI